jgi:RNA polymerase subunit RPABC4/transcription elongation factor Spt4
LSQLKKYKTILYIIHKELKCISKNELELEIKQIWDLEGSSNNFTSEEMDILILICYELAKQMEIELDEDKAINLKW